MSELLTSPSVINTLILSTVLLYLLYRYLTRNFNYWKDLSIPFVKPIPIFGNFYNVLTLRRTIGHFLADLYNGLINVPYFGIFILGTPTLVVTCPHLIKNILQNNFEYFSDRSVHSGPETEGNVEKNMLFFQRGDSWRDSRKRLTGAFTSGKLKAMVPLINDSAKQMVAFLSADKQDVDAKSVCIKFTTTVIASCAFGLEVECFKDPDNGFLNASNAMFKLDFSNAIRSVSYFFLPTLVDTFKLAFIKPEITHFLKDAFMQTINLREQSKIERRDLVHVLLQIKEDYKKEHNTSDFDDMKIVSQAMQFYLAGFETSSSTIAFTLYELALNESIQNKLRNEILQATSKSPNNITYENIMSMKYLDECISETLRKYPVLPFLDRRCVRDYPIPDGSGHVIKCGTPVYIPMFGLHYDPKYFPEPDRYNPDRFNPSNEEQQHRHPFSYLPFGQGPHNCIGERFGLISTKIGLIYILMNYEVRRNESTPVPIVFDSKSFVLQSTVGLPMTFVKYFNKIV